MNEKQKGMLMGTFVSDAFALGAHWVYKTDNIDSRAGRITDMIDPLAANFHPKRSAGEFTHYGDQMLFLYNYLSANGEFNADDYIKLWYDFSSSYDGYIDHAMRETASNISQGIIPAGSDSTDFAGLMYVPFLTAFNAEDLSSVVEQSVKLTHNSEIVIGSAKFLAAVLSDVLAGERPITAIKNNIEADYLTPAVRTLIKSGLDSEGLDTRETITKFGPSCPADMGLPGAVHLIVSYEDDFETALIENVMAGGDSAARGIFTASVLGAHNGLKAIPERWIKSLKARIDIN